MTPEARVVELRAALAAVDARLDRVLGDGVVPFPLRGELGLIRAACKGAIEIDDKAAEETTG